MEVALLLALTTLAGSAAAPDVSPAVALTRRIQERHHALTDMKARFVQTYSSAMLGRRVVERGTVALKRPGRMRWEYDQPEKKLFVSDGKKSYFYVPADRQVIVHETSGERGVALQLLAGRSDLLTEFQAMPAPDGAVRLVPKSSDAEVQEAVVEADASGRIRRLEIIDLQGNRSEFRFDEVKENVGLSDRLFQFEIPKGVEVIGG